MSATHSVSLHGIIPDFRKDQVSYTLRGLCGSDGTELHIQELVCAPSNAPLINAVRTEDILLRLRRDLASNDPAWSISLLGHPEPRRSNVQATVRPSLSSVLRLPRGADWKHALGFLSILGFSLSFELVKKGVEYTYVIEVPPAAGQRPSTSSSSIKIAMYQVYIVKDHDLNHLELLDSASSSWIVEAYVSDVSTQDQVQSSTEQLRGLRNAMKGTIDLMVVDPLVLQNKNLSRA